MSPANRSVSAREVAARVIARVTTESAFAAAALDGELRKHPQLGASERALATEFSYGVLRTLGYLTTTLSERSKRARPLEDPVGFAELAIGAYTLLFLDNIPPFAAVSEAVEGVRRAAGRHAGDYANAVLRRLADDVARDGRPSAEQAIWESLPGWLRGSLRRSLGRQRAFSFVASGAKVPPIGLAARSDRAILRHALQSAVPHAQLVESQLSPRGLLGLSLGNPKALPGFEHDFIVQEEGAQVVALLLAARNRERILDACAGRGNKSWFLATLPNFDGQVTASDLSPNKLEALRRPPRDQLGIQTHAVDWSIGVGNVDDQFDAALVDAPCSGTGTLRRRPEIALSRQPESIAELSQLQIAIAQRVATRVRPGGRLVFAVCSVLAEETTEVVNALSQSVAFGRRLVPDRIDNRYTPWLAEPHTHVMVTPDREGCDGYFIGHFRVEAIG